MLDLSSAPINQRKWLLLIPFGKPLFSSSVAELQCPAASASVALPQGLVSHPHDFSK
jgi:hypothetical protein